MSACAWMASRPSSSRNLFLWESASFCLTACDLGRADASLWPQCGVQPAEGQWKDIRWSNRKDNSFHGLATPAGSEPRVFQGLLPGEKLPKGGRGGRTRGKKRQLPGVLTPALGLLWPCHVQKCEPLLPVVFYCGKPPGLRREWSHWASEGPPGGIGLDPWERGQGGTDEGREKGRCLGSGELGQGRGPSSREGCALGTRLCGIG